MVVPETGGNTCASIKKMAGGHLNESDVCAVLQKEERVCCPKNATNHEVDTSLPSWNISAIIPTCDRLHSLQDAIESALNQTYPVLEVIVPIDSGPDCVKSIKNIWESKDDRVRVFKVPPCPQPPCGVGRNRNHGIKMANPYATHFALLDDDDVWYPHKTEIQVKTMKDGNYSYSSSDSHSPRNDRCHGSEYKSHDLDNGEFFLSNGGKFKKFISKRLNVPMDAELPSHITQTELSAHNIFVASATIFSKDIYYATSGFDEGVDRREDYRLWLEFAKISPGLFITDPLVVYDNNRNGCDVLYTSDLYVDAPPEI
jgi:glycosyltransferase involved in cell wall biosynthesis